MINRGIEISERVEKIDDHFEEILNKQFDFGTPYSQENLETLREQRY